MRAPILCGLILLLAGAGCARYPLNPAYAGPRALPAATVERYALGKRPLLYTDSLLEERPRYAIRRVQLPAARTTDPRAEAFATQEVMTIDYYRVKGEGTTPVIVFLPILGGDYREIEVFSEYFADHGYAALIVHRDQNHKEHLKLETLEPSLRQIVLDHKLAIDWIETQENLDPERIGVLGISMGGIKAALVTALDPRVRASVLALAGGDLPSILTRSSEKAIIRQVDAMMRERHVGREELARMLAAEIETDPLHFSGAIDARKVLMVLAVFDTVVPYEDGKKLAAAIGGPEEILLLAGHYSSLLFIYYVRSASYDFFERTFAHAARARGRD